MLRAYAAALAGKASDGPRSVAPYFGTRAPISAGMPQLRRVRRGRRRAFVVRLAVCFLGRLLGRRLRARARAHAHSAARAHARGRGRRPGSARLRPGRPGGVGEG